MKNRIKYKNELIEARVINDFLPSPEDLSLKERKTKVTLTLTEKSLNFLPLKTRALPYLVKTTRISFRTRRISYYKSN